jgi:PAS domain S-box-containing protein
MQEGKNKMSKKDRTRKASPGSVKESVSKVKETIRDRLQKRPEGLGALQSPEIAVEVVDQEIEMHKPMEQALVAEHLFRKTIEKSIPVGIAGYDENGKQIYANRVFCEMVDWRSGELTEMRFPQPYWILERSKGSLEDGLSLLKKIIGGERFEFQLQKKNGKRFWVLVASHVLSDSRGDTIGRLVSITDINSQKQAENELRKISAKLITAQEKERKLISQELHDSIGGKLTGIKYSLENTIRALNRCGNKTAKVLEEILASVGSTLEETQRITKNLHPSVLDDLGLIAAMRGYCREFVRFYPSISVSSEFKLDEEEIPESIKIMIYRVFQEAMNNAGKHSGAGRLRVTLQTLPGEVVLAVEDDGSGFDPKAVSDRVGYHAGLGLENMKERTELYGGKLDLVSAVGKGTKVFASWPLPG